MKPLFTCYFLFLFVSLGNVTSAFAQQAKAFEKITYTATNHNKDFTLYYADDYLAATTLKVSIPNGKTRTFLPESGTLENNGAFVLRAKTTIDQAKVILYGIDEDTEAPQQIKAVYIAKQHRVALTFKRAEN